jgi:hypothetical protein
MDSNSNSPFRHFESFTLSPGDMAGVVIFTAAFYITLLAVCRTRVFDRKKLAFCLTAVNALLMFCLALIYVSVKYKLGHNLFDYNGGEYSWWTGRDNFSAVALIMFGTANVMDLSLGWVFYREHLYLLTTWVHHFVYIWLVVLVVTGNGYVASLPTPYTPAFMCALLEELPTFLLALGTIFPHYRQDFAFGVAFSVTRIVLHVYLLVYMLHLGPPPLVVILCYVNPLLLHLHWFSGWFSKYAFVKTSNAKKEKHV